MINVPLLTRKLPNLKVKILAIGAGGLQRALTHELVHDLIKADKYDGGIFVGQPRHTSTAEALNQQGGLYHVVTFNKDGVIGIKLIESVVGASTLSTPEGKEKFLSWVKGRLDLILVGVTEAGVRKGQIGMDVLDETLFRYFSQHGVDSNISVMDTDNLRGNGKILRDIQLEYAKERGIDSYISWLESKVDFLDEMGDRLVPNPGAVPEVIKEEARRKIGKEDRLATYTEPMPDRWSLVISDPGRILRVPFSELAHRGVVVTTGSIDPYHDWKLRLINSVHIPFISHLAQLSGYRRINDAALDPLIRPYLCSVVEGNARIVEKDIPIKGENAVKYALGFVERISSLEDDAARININHTLKLRERISGTIISPHYAAAPEDFKNRLAFAIGTVFRYLTPVSQEKDAWVGRADTGTTYQFTDPNPTIPSLLTGTMGKNEESVEKKVRQIFYDYSLWTPPGSKQKVNLSGNPDCMRRVANFYHRMVNGEKAFDVLRRL